MPRYGDEWSVGMTGPLTFGLGGLAEKSVEEIYQAYEQWDRDPERGAAAIKKRLKTVLEETSEGGTDVTKRDGGGGR